MPPVTAFLPPAALVVLAAIFGLIFGSFITALSYRLPRGISIAQGRSGCTACGTTLTARDLVPVFSWALSGGACRTCGAKVSWRYPAIEVGMAALFVAAVLLVTDPVRLAVTLAATPAMVALAVIDVEHRRLPNSLIGYLALVALTVRTLGGADFLVAFLSAGLIFGAAVALDAVGRRVLKQGLGMGDAKLMAVVALALSPIPLLAVVAGAAALTVIIGVVLHFRGRQTVLLPFGPPLLLGFWVALVIL